MSATLAIDQSISGQTGFALLCDNGALSSGSFVLCASVADRAAGFRELWRWLDATHKAHGVGLIAHEQPIKTPADDVPKLVALYGLVAVIELFAIARGIGTIGYPARSWRSTFFSREERASAAGERWKRLAVERARQLGFDPASHDEAEAIGILDHHLHRARRTPSWRAERPFLATLA